MTPLTIFQNLHRVQILQQAGKLPFARNSKRVLLIVVLLLSGVGGNYLSTAELTAKRVRTNMGGSKNKSHATSQGKSQGQSHGTLQGNSNSQRSSSASSSRKSSSEIDSYQQIYGYDMENQEERDSTELARLASLILFSGYDHPASSRDESLCVTNHTSSPIRSLTLDITYVDSKERMIHRRDVTVKCDIPPGETRTIIFRHYDPQKTLYFYRSKPPRSGGMPYNIHIRLKNLSGQ